jgi:hypothetical protein
VYHKMALRPNILTDAALHIAFEVSILLQYTDINLFELKHQTSKPSNILPNTSALLRKDSGRK